MSSNSVEKKEEIDDTDKKRSTLKDRFNFPCGGKLMILYQLLNGMGNYCFILSMPIYMASMLKFSDSSSTTIHHAKSGLGMFLNIFGAILADSFIGRSRTYLYIFPFYLLLVGLTSVLSIYSQTEGILVSYFLIAISGGLVGPAVRAIIADQIPQNDKTLLGTFMHIIYFINNFGIIIIAYTAPIMHKDIYCFGIECYPLVFFVSFLLSTLSFSLILIGLLKKYFVIFKPTNNLLLNIFRCIHLALKKRIALGKPPKGSSWLDYARERFDESFINDIKVIKGLLIFLLAHPIFWTVFEQMTSIWTLQAQYMDGMISESFVIKADQMMTLNPILVVILIPIFELFIYPCLTKINLKVPYRIMTGQIFTVFACISMIFIQLKIDQIVQSKISGNGEMNIVNLANGNVSVTYHLQTLMIPQSMMKKLIIQENDMINVSTDKYNLKIPLNSFTNKISSIAIYEENSVLNFTSAPMTKQTNGGYTNVRIFNNINSNESFTIELKGRIGINKDFSLSSTRNQFGKYSKCGIGLFDVYYTSQSQSVKRKLGEISLLPAETITLFIKGNSTHSTFIKITESKLNLPSIIWQFIPYLMVTIGEVLFNVNTGIFLYGEAPLSMKTMILAAEYTCIALGNVLILILRQILGQLSMVYLFIICAILVAVSAVFTGILGYFYLQNKFHQDMEQSQSTDVTKL